jgi:hypothetical protein
MLKFNRFACVIFLGMFEIMCLEASAAESSFIDVECLSGGANSRTSFNGWIFGTAEPLGEGFVVKGSKIEVFTKKIEDAGCRSIYEDKVNVWGDEWETKRFNRPWNALEVKVSNSSTYMTCALGSLFTSTVDASLPFEKLTLNKVDSVEDRLLSRSKVSSSKCLVNGLKQ